MSTATARMTDDERYRLAHAAGWDAGNRHASAAGRTAWTSEDYDVAAREMDRLLGDEPVSTSRERA